MNLFCMLRYERTRGESAHRTKTRCVRLDKVRTKFSTVLLQNSSWPGSCTQQSCSKDTSGKRLRGELSSVRAWAFEGLRVRKLGGLRFWRRADLSACGISNSGVCEFPRSRLEHFRVRDFASLQGWGFQGSRICWFENVRVWGFEYLRT